MGAIFQPGQLVRVNLAGLQAEGVMFQAAVTDAVGHIVKQTASSSLNFLPGESLSSVAQPFLAVRAARATAAGKEP